MSNRQCFSPIGTFNHCVPTKNWLNLDNVFINFLNMQFRQLVKFLAHLIYGILSIYIINTLSNYISVFKYSHYIINTLSIYTSVFIFINIISICIINITINTLSV